MRTFTIVLLNLFVISNCIAQNFLRDEGESGINLGARYTGLATGSLIEVQPSYTLDGRFDLGASLGFQTVQNSDEVGLSFVPSVSYLVYRGDRGFPVSVNLNGTYQYTSFNEGKTRNSIFSFSTTLLYELEISDFSLFPGFSLGYLNARTNFVGINTFEESELWWAVSATAQMDRFWLKPEIRIRKAETRFSLGLGYLL